MASPASNASASSSAAASPSTAHRRCAPAMDRDRYYGQEALATICEGYISALFQLSPPAPHGILTPPPSPPSKSSSPPVLVEFIAYALYRTRLPPAIVYQALLLLERLKQRYPSARGTASSPHRLFLAALMLSSKMAMDDTYSNKSWAIVGGNCFALREVNQMERELFAFLGCNVHVGADDVLAFQARLEGRAAAANAPPSPVASASKPLAPCSMPPTPPLSPTEPTPSSLRATVKRRRAPSSEEMNRARRAADAAVALLRPLGGPSDGQAASRMAPSFVDHRSGWSSSSASSGASTPASPHPTTPPHRHGGPVGMGIMAPRPSLAWPAQSVRPGGKMAPPPPGAYAQWPPAPASAFAYSHGWA